MTNPTMRQALRQLIANDTYAATFQSMDQYRTALLQHADSLLSNESTLTAAAHDVLAERQRQIEQKGWKPELDDRYTDYSLARAAATYVVAAAADHADRVVMDNHGLCTTVPSQISDLWPSSWAAEWLKPKSRRKDLIRAGALVLAEIERLDRAAQLDGSEGETA